MNYLDAILLMCFRIFNGDRSRSAIYHLLTGKKISQTIQDAHLYGISNLFQTMPAMSRSDFDKSCQNIIEQKLILQKEDRHYILTEKGDKSASVFFKNHPFPRCLEGWKYHDRAQIFWKRLSLLVQTLSYTIHGESRFYPVQRDPDIQRWVRSAFQELGPDRKKKTLRLYDELIQLCSDSRFPDNPDFLIQRLTGYEKIGWTAEQLAAHFQIDSAEVHFRFLNILHYVMAEIDNAHKRYPILHSMQQDLLKKQLIFTSSTEKTFQLMASCRSIPKIAKERKLKESTIEDHIIEIALMSPAFAVEEFVPQTLQEKIWKAASNSNNKKMRELKQAVPEASFFQIRLVLVTRGREDGKWKKYYTENSVLHPSEKARKK
ncbi:helix-turn-helix domain-containing protein [Jeotgalibacillus proteolyticus]|uniref:Helicase Helix-turn-helix domain-containing protein n=1 Tax=Jeotgalibacillus proteolyticus TaxID=2082395 RepID=A0A2S5GE46_9BACL|nr:helix-turn-helix domain-containing protein [Jeotgalibacillus proteolyticus]PPA71290.1 hypothetical protein C4B60_04285 [Jeotgalibacillus proteolyticus]